MIFNSLGDFAEHLLTMEADVKLACDAPVVRASKLVAKTSKRMIGHKQPFWLGLKPETIAARRGGTHRCEMMGRLVFGAMVHGGSEYWELKKALHILKHAAHETKELFEEMGGEEE
jgi:hypothetical protein